VIFLKLLCGELEFSRLLPAYMPHLAAESDSFTSSLGYVLRAIIAYPSKASASVNHHPEISQYQSENRIPDYINFIGSNGDILNNPAINSGGLL
jgi:hypothetical protein